MRRLILIVALSVLVSARPETYKETEDFQYARSSSDDGTKSGFYGAQRGNMGGNYERAHNMDTLAQNQMSGLVRQVDGELGDGSRTRTGSVYTAANSRGIYGSGNYDLTNLQGRNFAEGETTRNSQSHSSLSSHNSRHGSQSYSGMESNAGISSSQSQDARYSGYQTSRHADQRRTDNLQAFDATQGLGRYESNNQAGYNTKYHTQFDARGRSEFDQSSASLHSSNGYDANSQAHFITTPVRVVVRPGGRVAIPITAPTYEVSQNFLPDNNGNGDAEVLNQHVGQTPTNKVKHYEASYSYRKQWEKHHAIPGEVSVVVPTQNPFPKNSELYEDAQLLQSSKNQLENDNLQTVYSGQHMNSDRRTYAKSASGGSRFQAGRNSQHSQSGFESQQNQARFDSQQSHSDLSSQQSQAGVSSQQTHSGFNSQESSAFSKSGANTHGRIAQNSGVAADLTNAAGDVNSKPKSYHSSYSYHKSWERQGDPYVIKPVGPIYNDQASERLTAASTNSAAYSSHQYGSHSRQAHQSYAADCDDQGHIRVARSYNTDQELEQGQNQWEDLGQQTQSKLENLEDLGQQQQNRWDNLQELGQETQNQWDNLQQLGQQTQNQWDNLQELGQQIQSQQDDLQQLGQQTQDKGDNLEDLGQHTHTHRDLEQHTNENLEDFSQLSQKEDTQTNFEHQVNNQNENLDFISQHIQKVNSLTNIEQQTKSQNEHFEEITEHAQKEDILTNFEQQTSNQNENLDVFNQHSQNEDSLPNFEQQANNQIENLPYYNNWVQSTNSESQSKADFVSQFMSVNKQINNNQNLYDQNQLNMLFQSNANEDKNTESYDFMKQMSQWTQNSDKILQQQEEKTVTVNDKGSSNTEYGKSWHQNNDQDVFWNKNDKYENNFWDMNNFHDFNKQKENIFPPDSFTNSDVGNPLQGLWDKIDNIGGEVTPTENNTNKLIGPDSNVDSKNEKNNPMQIDHSSNYTPVNSYLDLANINNKTESNETKIEHNNLFNEQTQNTEFVENILIHNNLFNEQNKHTSTTISPILLPHYSRIPEENVNKSVNTHDTQAIDENTKPNRNILGHNNLFNEQRQEINTSVSPALLPHVSPSPVENDIISINTSDQQPSDKRQNMHSQDEGRGDIGPEETSLEITITNKQHKTREDNETFSLRKEAEIPREGDVINQQRPVKNKDQNINTKLLDTNLNQQENTNKNRQNDLFTRVQPKLPTTMPTLEISTVKTNIDVLSEQPPNQPILDILDMNNNPLLDLQKQTPNQRTGEHIEIPGDVQEQNLEQQFEDFSQIQNSWIPVTDLQQGYDQQNTEQQFEDLSLPENIQNQNPLHDFGEHAKNPAPSLYNVQNKKEHEFSDPLYDRVILNTTSTYEQKFTAVTVPNTLQVLEPIQISYNTDVSSKHQNLMTDQKADNSKSEDVQSKVETIAEKSGFWKSIGNKFTSAKNKVISWFSSS